MDHNTERTPGVNKELCRFDADEVAFFKLQSGISDEEELKRHVTSVAERAFAIFNYRCIRDFTFLRINISNSPAYQHLLTLGRERKDAILLDVGCCFGNDIRKAVMDGFPAQQAIASDLRPEFWDLGHDLFRSTPSSFPVAFIAGDAFESSFLANGELSWAPIEDAEDFSLRTVRSLNDLKGRVRAIHTSRLFHLFSEDRQLELGQKLATLLSSASGSMIFGQHRGLPKSSSTPVNLRGEKVFCHSAETWTALWNGAIFPQGSVKVNCVLQTREQVAGEDDSFTLWWSVMRI